jgi:FSR family fosmidomycin resistance protein-like MFS transporter
MSGAQAAPTVADAGIPVTEINDETAEEFHTTGVVTVSAGHAVHDTYSGFLRPLLPTFITTLGLTTAQAGVLTVFMQWPSLFQPVLGYIADRASLRIFFVLAPTVTAVAMSLVGIAPTYGVLAMLLVVAGLSSAMMHAAGPAVVGKLSGSKLGRGMGFWMVGGELGRTLGPLIIVTTVEVIGLRGTPWLMVAGPVTSVILYFVLRNVPDIASGRSKRLPLRRLVRGMGSLLAPLAAVVAARAFLAASLATYLPVFMTQEGSSLWMAGLSLTVFEAAGVVGALLGGSMSDRLGRRRVLFVSMLVASGTIFVFLAASGLVQFLLLIVLGFSVLSTTPVFLAMVQEAFPDNRALATGSFMALSFIIRSAVVVVLGVLADRNGMRSAFVVSGLVSFAGLPFLFLLPRRTTRE